MRRRFVFLTSLLAIVALISASTISFALELTAAQKREIKRIETEANSAAAAFKAKKFPQAAEKVNALVAELEKGVAQANPEVIKALAPAFEKIKDTHAGLALEGAEVSPIEVLAASFDPEAGAPVEGGVVFEKEIAPFLVGKCGRCHVTGNRGNFSMATFADMMKGTEGGSVILPKNGAGSRLVQVIEEGDMPRGGTKVTSEELGLLKKWIDEGARIDAKLRMANLNVIAADAKGDMPKTPEFKLTQATGKESVSFALDVAPVLVASCSGCHIDAQNARGGLNMTTFAGFMRGGDNGAIVVQGKPDDSLLIQKLKGTAGGERMPMGRDPLSDETIGKIAKWIEEGARFDGASADMPVETVYLQAKADKSSHEDLLKDRLGLAQSNWELVVPGNKPKQVETKNFLVVGNSDESKLKEIGDEAEAIAPNIVRLFRGSTKSPFVKGRMTLFVFGQRYDFSEFGTMVVKRELPEQLRGYARYSVIDAFAALYPDRQQPDLNTAELTQQLAKVYAASMGKNVPVWFADGASVYAVVKLVKNDPRVKEIPAIAATAASKMEAGDEFITGKMPEEDARIVSYMFIEYLMKDSKRFGNLITSMRKGDSFDAAFTSSYGGSPSDVAKALKGGNWKK